MRTLLCHEIPQDFRHLIRYAMACMYIVSTKRYKTSIEADTLWAAVTGNWTVNIARSRQPVYSPIHIADAATPTRLNSTVVSRRRRRCVLGISQCVLISSRLSWLEPIHLSIMSAADNRPLVWPLVAWTFCHCFRSLAFYCNVWMSVGQAPATNSAKPSSM